MPHHRPSLRFANGSLLYDISGLLSSWFVVSETIAITLSGLPMVRRCWCLRWMATALSSHLQPTSWARSCGRGERAPLTRLNFCFVISLKINAIISSYSAHEQDRGKIEHARERHESGRKERRPESEERKREKICADRELNPGPPRGRRRSYHWTIGACSTPTPPTSPTQKCPPTLDRHLPSFTAIFHTSLRNHAWCTQLATLGSRLAVQTCFTWVCSPKEAIR